MCIRDSLLNGQNPAFQVKERQLCHQPRRLEREKSGDNLCNRAHQFRVCVDKLGQFGDQFRGFFRTLGKRR